MALGGVSTGYGSLSLRHRLFFDGDEQNYEAWEEKFLGYLLVKDLKKTVLAAATVMYVRVMTSSSGSLTSRSYPP